MPKIRGVKPDYWTDEDIVDLTIPARLLFIGLWSYACDNGHLQDKPKQIKMRVLPGDDVNCSELLRELEEKRRINRSSGWITVPNFTKHQKPDRRYFQTCDKPGCGKPERDSQPETRGGHDETTTSAHRGLDGGSMGPRGDGDGDGDGEVKVKGSEGDQPSPRKRATQLPNDFAPNDTNRRVAAEQRVSLDRVLPNFIDWHRAKGSKFIDWHAALNTWVRREKPDPDMPQPTSHLPHVSEIEQPPDGLSPQEYAEWDHARRQRQATNR